MNRKRLSFITIGKQVKEKEAYIEQLESALIDLLDGDSAWYEIQYKTGCSDDRCKEIETLYHKVKTNYEKRHGIK
jgi:hypothetical protein